MKVKWFIPFLIYSVGLSAHEFPKHPPTDYHFAFYPNFLMWDYTQPEDDKIADYGWSRCNGLFQNTLSEQDVVNTMHYEPGLGVTFKYIPNAEQDVEFRFMGLLKWWGRRTVAETALVSFPFTFCTVDWALGDKIHAANASTFNNYDITWWFHTPPRKTSYFAWGWGAGARYLSLDETFDITMYKSDRISFYNMDAHNDVMGAQLAGEFSVHPYRFVSWGFSVRGGIAADALTTQTYLSDNNNTDILRNARESKVHVAWFAEANPYIALDIHSRATLHIAYDAIYMQGVALAGDQIYYGKKVVPLDDSGRVGVHGLQAGFTFRW